ncbi:MAG: 2Fe-2S iron-sulfur cluster-binding protein [Myxococcota bacterium]
MIPRPRVLPERWRRRAEQALRDARFVWSTLTRRPPPILVHRRERSPRRGAGGPVEARITSVRRETPDAVVLELLPTDDRAPAPWLPGQFVTLEVARDGERLRRCYSLCVPPGEGRPWTVAAKRVPGGRVSPWLVDEVREGDVLRVHPPAGRFTVRTDPSRKRRLVAVAGGSGITPIMAILEAVLADEPRSRVVLVDGNRRLEDVLFRERLDDLARDERMGLRHVLEEPPEGWEGGRGRLEPEVLGRELDAAEASLGEGGEPVEYFLCGPPGMRESAREVLRERGVPSERVHEERFTRPVAERTEGIPREPQHATIRVDGREARVRVDPGRTLLEAALDAGLDMPFTCAMGGCGACRCRLREGDVAMEETSVLTDEERAAGWILACVSRPATPVVVEVER